MGFVFRQFENTHLENTLSEAKQTQSISIVLEEGREEGEEESMPFCHPGRETGRSNQGGNELTALRASQSGQALEKKGWRVKGLFSFSAPIT